MTILDGRKIAKNILAQLKERIKVYSQKPGLGVILVGQDEASRIYVSLKEKAARESMIEFRRVELPENVSEEALLQEIEKLNNDHSICGMIVQLPLPEHLNKDRVIAAIDPEKDVDGFHEENAKLFFKDKERFYPVFPEAIISLIKESKQSLQGKRAIVISNSHEFGSMMTYALKREELNAEYVLQEKFLCDKSSTKNVDVVITACGVANLLSANDVKDGSIVIDGGIVKEGDRVVGDLDLESFRKKNAFVSPVPGGVGPVTIACLLKNVFEAYKKSL